MLCAAMLCACYVLIRSLHVLCMLYADKLCASYTLPISLPATCTICSVLAMCMLSSLHASCCSSLCMLRASYESCMQCACYDSYASPKWRLPVLYWYRPVCCYVCYFEVIYYSCHIKYYSTILLVSYQVLKHYTTSIKSSTIAQYSSESEQFWPAACPCSMFCMLLPLHATCSACYECPCCECPCSECPFLHPFWASSWPHLLGNSSSYSLHHE
jgi:hypothetical protein